MTNNQDGYQIKENEGRKLLESLLIQTKNASNWRPTTGKYDHVDGFYNLNDKKIVVEIKTRSAKYADYSTHLMELDKYMNLTKAMIDNKCFTGFYACFFENILYLYDLRNMNTINCRVIEKYVNCTTVEDKGKRMKKFLDIPIKLAKVFRKDNDKWKKVN